MTASLQSYDYSSVPLKAGDTTAETPSEDVQGAPWRLRGASVQAVQSVLILLLAALLAYTALSGSGNTAQCAQPQQALSSDGLSQSVASVDPAAHLTALTVDGADAAQTKNLSLPLCPAPIYVGDPGYVAPSEAPRGCDRWRFGRYSLLPAGDAAPPASYPEHVFNVHSFLISFPRSGNTMTRKILEDGTGVVTGTVYNDLGLKRAGFQGEMQRDNVLLIKHHFLRFSNHPKFDISTLHDDLNPAGCYAVERYVYVIRNPMDSMVSFFNKRRLHNHAGQLGSIPLPAFTEHILTWLPIWAEHVRFFTSTFLQQRCRHCEFMLAKYEDFINYRRGSLLNPADRMLCFLGYSPDRGCRTEEVAGDESAGVSTYYLKARHSLFNSSIVLPRNVSYAEEVFSYLSEAEIHRIELEAGLEMKAHGYWPIRSYY